MKMIKYSLLGLICLFSLCPPVYGQEDPGVDSTGLPGDNFSLQGALEMFKKSASPEEFEKLLNTEDNHVNNLDLNEDGEIDYVRVIDRMDQGTHVFILQIPVSETESQDIATIELEKTGDANAVVQIIGDEDIYGNEIIVEPGDEGATGAIAPSYYPPAGGPDAGDYEPAGIIVNVWFWPSVRYVYAPAYVVWRSPWRWRAYPTWWRPWRPAGWRVFHPYMRPYHTHYVIVRTNRIARARSLYRPMRTSSVSVTVRHQASVSRYRVTHTRTTVTGPRGNSVSRKSTTVQRRGVKARKTRHSAKRNRP